MYLLLIDDEASLRRTLRTTLESMRHNVAEAGSGEQAVNWLRKQRFDVAFLDLRLGRETGMDLLPVLLREAPELAVIVITAHASIASAVEAMRAGAFDYLPKPFTPDQLRVVLERWRQVQRLRNQVASLEEQVRSATPETDLDTQEPVMRQALDLAFQVAASEATLLLRGESGTGKGVLARAIHERSPRAGGPFVIVHCPSLSGELLESELFGHVRGAFTGAVLDTEGKVAAAEGGSLFLDEIADLPPTVQPKLLRLLQDRCYERVGETKTRIANVRIIAASNRDLSAEVAAGRFREDLFYRLNVIDIELPPLRQRPHDILPLAKHLLRFFARQTGKILHSFTPEAEAALLRHQWPGNIRELRNAIERGVILATTSTLDRVHLPGQVGNSPPARVEIGGEVTLDTLEAEHIRRVLAASASLEDAAATLGIDPSTLYRKRKRYGL
ncbi:MAG TPA: sigma-54 dependent transcriptional regulator [Gemmataceae bacterium]|nr:sigma-54 dependent transcriptional regulator [Gemmataceae bacterium]